MLKDFSDTFVGLGRALEVVSGTDLLLDFFALENIGNQYSSLDMDAREWRRGALGYGETALGVI